jgi:hypothetical protein
MTATIPVTEPHMDSSQNLRRRPDGIALPQTDITGLHLREVTVKARQGRRDTS